MSNIAQVIETRLINNIPAHVKRVDTLLKYVRDNPVHLLSKRLDHQSLHLIVFSDESFQNNQDLYTNIWYILFLRDLLDHSIPLALKYYKEHRIVRSVLSGELIYFADMLDIAHTTAVELRRINPRKPIPLRLCTGGNSLFD